MGKLKSVVIGKDGKPMSEAERQAKILYYRDCFWLDFRVGHSNAGDQEVKYYQDLFASIGASDVFDKLYLDYLVEQLDELKKHAVKYATEVLELKNSEGKIKKKIYDHMLSSKQRRVVDNLHAQEWYEARIAAMQTKESAIEK